jgi:serine/threonine-protein kinase
VSAVPEKTDDAMVGRIVLGRYRILRHLADGGMGTIYLARNEGAAGFVRPVVIKWVLPTHSGDAKIAELFMREARIMAKLSHPDIVSVLDFAEEDGMYIMALEYVHGFTLGRWARFIKKFRGEFPVDIAVQVAIKVLSALDYAHTLSDEDGKPMRVVHRDVTPSNILIDTQGHVKLADFGVAGIASEKTSVGDDTIKGKFAYMPPESFERVPASAVTDVYSTAVTLHEILSGRNEFASESMAEVVGLVLRHVPARLDTLRTDLPPGLADVIALALAKNPKERYQSASSFARALAQTRRTGEAEVAQQLKQLADSDFRDDRLALMSSMPSLTELESAWRTPVPEGARAPTSKPMRAQSPPVDTVEVRGEPPQRSRTKPWIILGVVLVLGLLGAVAWVAISALQAAKTKSTDEQPMIIVDQRPGTPATPAVTPDAAVAQPAAVDAGAASSAVDASAGRPTPTPSGDPSGSQLTRAFNKHTGAVTACFREHSADAKGEIGLRFHVGTDGKVIAAEVLPESLSGTPFAACLQGVARKATFGPQAKEVKFRIPLQAR